MHRKKDEKNLVVRIITSCVDTVATNDDDEFFHIFLYYIVHPSIQEPFFF